MKQLTWLWLALLLSPLAQANMQLLDRIVAVVDDNVITQTQLDERVAEFSRQIADSRGAMPPKDIMQKQVLEHMILDNIQMQLAARGGIRIDDNALNTALTDIARRNDMTLEAFANQIRTEGTSWAEFREQIRKQIAIGHLRQNEVSRRVHVSDREIDQFLASASAKKLFAYDLHLANIVIQLPEKADKDDMEATRQLARQVISDIEQGTDFATAAMRFSNAENALNGGDLGWRPANELPTLYTQAAETLQVGEISQPLMAGNGIHIIKLVDQRGNRGKQMATQYQVRHILIKTAPGRNNDQAQALAQKLRQQIVAGADFAELAREYSSDPGTASQGGSLDWVSLGDMVPPFESAMQNTPIGQLSPVFQTRFGWHFLQVQGQRETDVSDEFRRMQAAEALHSRYFDEQLQLWLRKIRTEAYVDIRL